MIDFGWQNSHVLGGTRPFVTRLFVRSDWSQTEPATSLCESLLFQTPFLSPIPSFSLTGTLASHLLKNIFSSVEETWPLTSCQVLHTSLLPPLSISFMLKLKVLLQLLLFFKCKLGYWVRAKSTWVGAEGNGLGIDKWSPFDRKPHVPRAELAAWHHLS